MRRFAFALTLALSTTACGVHPTGLAGVSRGAVGASAQAVTSVITAATRQVTGGTAQYAVTLADGSQTQNVVGTIDEGDGTRAPKLLGLTLDGAAVAPDSSRFAGLVRTLEDAKTAQNMEWSDVSSLDFLLETMVIAAPPAAPNGWTLSKASYGGGDSEGIFQGTVTKGNVHHVINVETTELGGLKADWLRSVNVDGKPVAMTDKAGLAAVEQELTGVKLSKADDLHGVWIVATLLRQSKWNR